MKSMTIGQRISLGFATILLLALTGGGVSQWKMTQISNNLKLVSAQYLPVTELSTRVESEFLNARIHFIYFVTIQKKGSLEKGWDQFRNAQKDLAELEKLISKSEALTSCRPLVANLRHDFDSYQPVLEHIIDVVRRNQNSGPDFDALMAEWARIGGSMVDSAGKLSRVGSRGTRESATLATVQLAGAVTGSAGLALIGFPLVAAIVIFTVRGINRVLNQAIRELDEGASQVASTSAEVSSLSQQLAQGASEQAASLEETSASSEEMASMTRKNVVHSQQAAKFMDSMSQLVLEANRTLGDMLASMREISSSSGKISKIIKVIDEIAFQTNILALNAAVEAARAGEAGMGFAVVADEVRNLAQRSARAAKDTASLIEESILKSDAGSTKLGEVVASIRAITDGASRVKSLVDEMAASSREQAEGIEQIARAVAQVDQVTQRTTASAEESASASEQLSSQSRAIVTVAQHLQALAGATS